MKKFYVKKLSTEKRQESQKGSELKQKRKSKGFREQFREEEMAAFFDRMSDHIVFRNLEIYADYIHLKGSIRKRLPMISSYIATTFYYDVLASKYSLTRNYVCRIITSMSVDKSIVDNAYLRAILNQKSDDYEAF